MDRQPKQYKVDEVNILSDQLTNSKAAVFLNYAGLGVKLQQELKKKLKEAGSNMLVAKNTLLKLASQKAEFPEDSYSEQVLSGQTALITSSEDAVAPVQILGKFMKENEIGKFKAGVIEGTYYDEAGLVKLSTLPSKETLYAQVVGGVSAPLYGLVGTLQGNLQKLVWVLDSYKNSKSA